MRISRWVYEMLLGLRVTTVVRVHADGIGKLRSVIVALLPGLTYMTDG